MAKEESVNISKKEYDLLKKVVETKTVIKVGNDKSTWKEQVKRYQSSNNELRKKVSLHIREKVELQEEIAKYKSVINGGEAGSLEMIRTLEGQNMKLRSQLDGWDFDIAEKSRLSSSVHKLKREKKDLEDSIKNKDTEIKKMQKQIMEFQKELALRIQEDSRFNNMDL